MRSLSNVVIIFIVLAFILFLTWPIFAMPSPIFDDSYRINEEDLLAGKFKLPPETKVSEDLARWLYSPGKLNKAHEIPKLTCNHCHVSLQKISDVNCRECHRIEDFRKKSDALLFNTHRSLKKTNCLECHWEHKGLRGAISVSFDEKGHELHLSNRELKNCQDCHGTLATERHLSLNKMGVKKCYSCHRTKSWKETDWNHSKIEGLVFANIKGFTKIKTPIDQGICTECHKKDFHGVKRNNQANYSITAVTGKFDCLVCHNISKGGDK